MELIIMKNSEQINKQMNKTNEKIDDFQETVIGLTQTIETIENKVSKNENEFVLVKDKVS